ncbi:MAG: glycosyltransferase [Desulfarculaceae bacterium]|jgi:glycosyltransferase involved in cell wall biosynthesis
MTSESSPGPGSEAEPIRLLRLIARLNVGGPAKHVAWLSGGLDQERFEQTLVAGRVAPDEDDMGPWFISQGLDYTLLPRLGRAISPWNDLVCLVQILRLLGRVKPHILETHTSKAGFLGRAALLLYLPWAKLRGWPRPKAIHTFHGHTFQGYFSPLKARVFLTLERILARLATWRIVVLSHQQLQEIQGRFQVGHREQYVILPLGIDLEPFSRAEEGRRSFRGELGLAPEQKLIGCVGRVAPVKNYGLFLESAAQLRSLNPDLFRQCLFVLIGGGSGRDLEGLRQKARELNLQESFRLLGNRSDPEAFYPGLDLLMLASLNEGTPMVILEAGACARPVLSTAVGGVPDLLGPVEFEGQGFSRHQRGLSAPSGDALALAQGLAWVLENQGDAQEMGLRLQQMVAGEYSRERLLRDAAALYQEAVDAA